MAYLGNYFYDLICCVLAILLLVYYMFRRRYNYWTNKRVYSCEAIVPFGNIKDTFLGKEQIGVDFANYYWKTDKKPFAGMFMMHRPTLLVNDLELSRLILTRDFVHFSDHTIPLENDRDLLFGHLFNLCGLKWKNLRAKLTPTFTTSKMKFMYDILAANASEMNGYLENNIGSGGVENVKNLLACFSNDIIASCAFGIECNSFKEPNNAFRKMGRRSVTPTLWEGFVQFLDFFVPQFTRTLKLKLFSKEMENFFIDIVDQTVTYREKNGIVRNDFLQLLIQLKNNGQIASEENEEGKIEELPDDGTRLTMKQLAAQVFVFFIAGFETSSTTASFALYELAMNPDVQSILAKEIDEVTAKHDGKITYNSLLEMNYLTQVIEETLRKYPPVPIIFRVCTKEYTIPDTDVVIEKDTPVMIPIYGIQRDPRYFQNPDKFEPERFDPENKKNIHHFAYLPFGEGPRICIGNRFGMMQTRLGLATILSKYEISPCEKTLIPMKYDVKSFILTCDGGVYLNLKKRVK